MNTRLVIYDANILIDFCKLGMVDELFRLGYDFHTVNLVWEELRTDQQMAYIPYVESGRLIIGKIAEGAEMEEVLSVRMSRPQLSIPDCTALIYAKQHKGILLTSDKNLRSTAQHNSVEVRGHLWIFDELFADEIVKGKVLISKLSELCTRVNTRLGLPQEECEVRIIKWNE